MTERAQRRRFDLAGGAGLVIWIVSLVFLFRTQAGPGRAEAQAVVIDGEAGLHEGDEWQSVYLKGARIGYLHLRKRRIEDGWHIRYELQLDLDVMKTKTSVRTELDARVDDAMLLRDFVFRMDGGVGGRLSVTGRAEGKRIHLELDTGGERTSRSLELPEQPRLSATDRALLATQGLAVGKEYELSAFDPASLSRRTVHIRVVGMEKVHVMGQSVDAFVLEQQTEGLTLKAWVTRAGDLIKEELPLGLVAIRETEEEARFGTGAKAGAGPDAGVEEGGDQDLLSLTAPELEGELPDDATALERLVLELDLPPDPTLALDGGRQRLSGQRVEVRREAVPERAAPGELTPEAAAALEPSLLVQSDHPAVRAKAREIAGEATDPVEQVRRLVDWLVQSIEKVNVVGIPSALETLKARRGDCNEHTTLFVALARALGIPARIDVGMVHKGGRFYYHAWPEVWLGGAWVTADPTWGQFPADVTHVRFIRGGLEHQLEMFKVIGRLRRVRLIESAP